MKKSNPYKDNGSSKKWKYKGEKKVVSIRLTSEERQLILSKFNSIQHFIQVSMAEMLKIDCQKD